MCVFFIPEVASASTSPIIWIFPLLFLRSYIISLFFRLFDRLGVWRNSRFRLLFQLIMKDIYLINSYSIGFRLLLIVYFLSRQLTAPFFFASTIADIKLNEISAPLNGAANAYRGFSNTVSRHCTAIVTIIKAMADSCSPNSI